MNGLLVLNVITNIRWSKDYTSMHALHPCCAISLHSLTKKYDLSFDGKIYISSKCVKSVSTNLWTPGVRKLITIKHH